MNYLVRRTANAPSLHPADSDPIWSGAQVAAINQFHPKSGSHRPIAEARLMHNDRHLFIQFRVQDRYVRCVKTEFQSLVSKDSCVEFFIQPRPDAGYFNFEINCGGAMLVYYIEDPTRTETAFFRKFTVIPKEAVSEIEITTTMPRIVEPERTEPTSWALAGQIPFSFFEAYVGPLGALSGQQWLGNFYKCGDETSHPHWASWSPIGEVLRFHQPDRFAQISFE